MPVEVYLKPGFGRRVRHISAAEASGLHQIDGELYTSIGVPSNVTPPSIAGDSTVGSTLTLTPGTYDDANSIDREWYVNDSASGETGLTLDTSALSEGDTVKVTETATGDQGFITQDSNEVVLTV